MPPVNPNSAFIRVNVDIPTPLAMRVDTLVSSGVIQQRSKRFFYSQAVLEYVEKLEAIVKKSKSKK
jgi:metal-responsive CopG/Arc/MetJ family transcriptional regulator